MWWNGILFIIWLGFFVFLSFISNIRYDFAVFGGVADIIGSEFFPSDNANMQLLQSLSVFGAAFFMRPLGGILMGWIGILY